ncbi:hypothetical protein BJF79_08545 [Actinomadura sp. CNU-125]|uniref:hypothetical protein n=1 Tax=Actinomadura sp. CNU-125 TaxID=1904961 RepID=UPI0009696D39|nr:hypothetical protein [Actinomadura sp. CNU-125]OLT31836.1 hypothetical protein BJF79_08545 [Actinomadura sp. CNU-125]
MAAKLFGFVPMQGEGAHLVKLVILRDGKVILRFDDDAHGSALAPAQLNWAFDTERSSDTDASTDK